MKKKVVFSILVSVCLLFSSGCVNKNIVKDSDLTEESLSATYGFTSFDLVIDTKEMKEALKANIEEKSDKTEAVYKNSMEEEFLFGNQAMEKLISIFDELSLNPETEDEELIKKTSEAFEVNDYKSLSIKIKFKGYDMKELKMIK
ncbi:YusW family protein [Sporosarcina sp. CAU 1771]